MVLYFRHIDLEKNRRRHYLLTVQRDLLGHLVVTRRWGRLGASGWQGSQTTPVETPAAAAALVRRVLQRRRQHGYQLVAAPEADSVVERAGRQPQGTADELTVDNLLLF